MSPLSDRTRRAHAVSPEHFRNVATGIGASVKESAMTGALRTERVRTGAPAPCSHDKPRVSRGY